MTEYYKGQRISELLMRINELQVVLDLNKDGIKNEKDLVDYVQGEASLAINKSTPTYISDPEILKQLNPKRTTWPKQ